MFLRADWVKTRKAHVCWGCGKVYPKGTRLLYSVHVEGRTIVDGYWCEVCSEYMQRYCDPSDDFGFGSLLENDPDGWEEIKREIESS